jgi:predicted DsbA family dithiol-disulfide isomerase
MYNLPPTDPKKVKLVVYSDMICPWCYVGQRELQNAIAQAKDLPLSFEVEYRPYQINASLNDDLAVDLNTYLNGKLGPEKYAVIKKMLAVQGAKLGINFQWGGKIAQTTRAHRMLLKAWQVGGMELQQKLLSVFFRIRFEESGNISDLATLQACAKEVGLMSAEKVQDFYDSDECLDEVKSMMEEARSHGVAGVPFTIIENRWAVSGGQGAETYLQIFKKLAACYASRGLCPLSKGPTEIKPIAPEPANMCGTVPAMVSVQQ